VNSVQIKVKKASGIVEGLDIGKLRSSLLRSGASEDEASQVIDEVLAKVEPYTSTKKIYKLARRFLRQRSRALGMRYSLKNALFRLGPSGYPFEKYFAELMRYHGYDVKVGVILEGKCVKHEVDVLAVNSDSLSIVECKYHNVPGRATDVKVAMYVMSRINDLQPVLAAEYGDKAYAGHLVTNTRCTSDAIKYAECSGLRIKSWKYPKNDSLEKMIEDRKLYPVTIISGIKTGLVETLVSHDIILLKDLVSINSREMMKMLSVSERNAVALKKRADALCGC